MSKNIADELNTPDKNGCTPLHAAASHGMQKHVNCLYLICPLKL